MDKLLTPDTGLMIWVIITFLCLVAILKLFAWGPLLGAIEAREGRIRADREGAEKARSEAERIQKESRGPDRGRAGRRRRRCSPPRRRTARRSAPS